MSTDPIIDSLWAQVRGGRHVGAIGFVPFPLAGAHGLTVARVSCEDAPDDVLGMASAAVRRLLGAGHTEESSEEPDLIDACNQLADASDGRAALVVDAVDAAAPASIAALEDLLSDPRLRLPLVLGWRAEPEGATLALLDAIHVASGAEAVGRAPARPAMHRYAWSSLRPEVLQILRAASMIGSRFDAESVAELLDVAPHIVIARIQEAVDAGAPIHDEGTGVFVLPGEAARALREGAIPSFAASIRARLARKEAPSAAPPSTDPVQASLDRARALWEGAGRAPSQTLREALAAVEAAERAMTPDTPLAVQVELASLLAGIAYELGERGPAAHAIERSLATRAAVANRNPELAARLANDEAALLMRFGDLRGAFALLEETHAVASRARTPTEAATLAATEHLLARAPLHASDGAAPRERILEALEHARTASSLYAQLGQEREAVRALETTARLELQANELHEAKGHLLKALERQQATGDLGGLARTTDALADLLASVGRIEEALQLVESSAEINLRRGATSALAYNRRTLARLRAAMNRGVDKPELGAKLDDLDRALRARPSASPS
jgi:tetratricopeptide (TPR) repeat protein